MTVRPARALVAAWLSVAATSVHATYAHQQGVFRSGVDVISVEVSVRDKRTPVLDLAAADFSLTDNQVPQRVETVSIEAVSIDVSLVIDTSGSAKDAMGRLKADVQKIANLLRSIDRLRVVTFDRDVHELLPMQPPSDHVALAGLTANGGTSLNDAMAYALMWPAPVDRRHLVVVFTDGEDSTSVLEDSAVPALASRADAVLHAVLFRPTVPAIDRHMGIPRPPMASAAALFDAAARTGGDAITLDDAVAAFRTIFGDFRQSYLLRYTLQGVPRKGWHDISVRVTRAAGERYTVRARKGYFGS